jgi:hypothetical protein
MSPRKFGPAPNPPRKGHWIDPEDPTRIRFHDGKGWTEVTYSREAFEYERPKRQGLFLLGAGKEGISTGLPLAEQRGRYLGRFGIWMGILAICGGFVALWVGVNHDVPALGWNGFSVIAGMFGFFAVTAWRAGLRPPGFGPDGNWKVRSFFVFWASIMSGSALGTWIAPAIPHDTIAYDWTNRVGMVLLNGAVLALSAFLLYAVWKEGHRSRTLASMLLVCAFALPALFLHGTWDRLQDALWLS